MKLSVLISYAANMRHKNVKKEQKHKLFIKKHKYFFLIVSLCRKNIFEYVT